MYRMRGLRGKSRVPDQMVLAVNTTGEGGGGKKGRTQEALVSSKATAAGPLGPDSYQGTGGEHGGVRHRVGGGKRGRTGGG